MWLLGIAALACLSCGSEVTTSGDGGAGGTLTSTGPGPSQGGGTASGGNGAGGRAGAGCEPALRDYGDCDVALGWAFDGEDCVPITGCDCAPDCAAFTADFESCVAGCAGHCDAAAFVGEGIASGRWGEGSFCDEIYTCVKADVVPTLETLVPAVSCEASGCPSGQQRCTFSEGGAVTAEHMTQYCSATLIEDLDDLRCLVVGP